MPVSFTKNTTFVVGERVTVSIHNRKRYACGCAEKLDGKTGVIEECKESSGNSVSGHGPAYLVKFDVPVQSWWTFGSPTTAFWFDPCDLV